MVFPVVMYRYENWTIQKDWALKDWYFQTVVLEKTVESPLDARRSNQSILKDINPEYSLVGLMLKVKLQYFGHLMGWANSLKKTLMLRKIEGRRRRGHRGWDGWMVSMIQWRWAWTNSRREWRPGNPGVLQFTGSQTVRHDLETEQQGLAHIVLIELQDLEKCDRLENSKWFQKMNLLSLENSTTCEMSCVSQVTL